MRLSWILFIILLLGFAQAAAAKDDDLFAHEQMHWSDLEYNTSIFFVSATSSIKLQVIKTLEGQQTLQNINEKDLILPAHDKLFAISTFSDAFGKKTRYQLWFDLNGRALQKYRILRGDKNELKLYRYSKCGYYSLRKQFNNEAFDINNIKWSDVTRQYHSYKSSNCNDTPITESNALLYLVPAMNFEKQGDTHELLVESKSNVVRVTLNVVSKTTLRTSYHVRDANGATRTVKNPAVLKIQLKPYNLDSSKNSTFEFLGLSGDIYLYLDMANRVISRLNGDIDLLGSINIDLTKMVMTQ